MKRDGHGQSEPVSEDIYLKIRSNFIEEYHQLLLDIAHFTGERWGAILQLQVEDIYVDPHRRVVREYITFRKNTRKDKETRQVPVHPHLQLRLKAYEPPLRGWLFPSPINEGEHLTMRAATRALTRALERANLDQLGFSSHGTRRGFITDLHNKGISIKIIQSLTGHKNLNIVSRYIEVSEEQRRVAIALR